jgi:4-amino-4-deoxy-L-arabinose transferase-like glycosyltransferase
VNGFVGPAFVAAALLPVVLMTVKNVTSTRRGNLALAAAFLAGAVILGAIAASRLEAISRLREHGLTANATTTNVDENFVSFTGHAGWETTVTVSFTDTSGRLVHAAYTDRARAGGKKAGQTIQIVYDPAKPTSISPGGTDPRWVDAFFAGLGVVVYLGFSVYFGYRAWRWRENGSDDD